VTSRRFLTQDEVCEELAISRAQLYAVIRRRELEAVKIGGRGQWRVERDKLEEYIARLYDQTHRFIEEHPWTGRAEDGEELP
jgi:excisionase family DNA binding protein